MNSAGNRVAETNLVIMKDEGVGWPYRDGRTRMVRTVPGCYSRTRMAWLSRALASLVSRRRVGSQYEVLRTLTWPLVPLYPRRREVGYALPYTVVFRTPAQLQHTSLSFAGGWFVTGRHLPRTH